MCERPPVTRRKPESSSTPSTTAGAGRLDRSLQVTDGGQNYLTQISGDTGGKVYLEGFGNPVSFAPFLSDIQRKLQNQYELTFVSTAKPGCRRYE